MEAVSMTCPSCGVAISAEWYFGVFGPLSPPGGGPAPLSRAKSMLTYRYLVCPACREHVVRICERVFRPPVAVQGVPEVEERDLGVCYPRASGRKPLPNEVTNPNLRQDYQEAALVLRDSPRASAALSRRCLQFMLRQYGGVKPGSLASEILEVLPRLPGYIGPMLEAVRLAGNLAAHPMFDKATGIVVDVEPDEAEHLLDLLDLLIDHYIVAPAKGHAVQAKINGKYKNAKK